jgi:hypothetical protein
MQFFRPEVFFQIGDNGTSGYAVGECPLLYYAVAILWKIFGYSDFIFRFFNLLIFFLGLFSLFRMLQRVVGDSYWAMVVPLLFFTSPTVVYYAANYLTETTSLAFTFMGWSAFMRYYEEKRDGFLYWAIFLFTIAGLLKIVALISVFTIVGLFVLETTGFRSLTDSRLFRLNTQKTLAFLASLCIVFGWYMFAIQYNKQHRDFLFDGSSYFLTGTFPIWSIPAHTIKDVIVQVYEEWMPDYFNFFTGIFLTAVVLSVLLFLGKLPRVWSAISILLLFGFTAFVLLWFYLFAIHDYYAINPLMMPLFFFIALLVLLKERKPEWLHSAAIKVVFALFLLFNAHYAQGKLDERYNGWQNEYPAYKDVHTITPYLRELGIKPEDKVISIPDGSTNYTLYLMNQKGWTALNFFNDSLQIKKYIGLGAKYLILTEEEPHNRPCLKPFMKKQVGQYGTVSIYSLQEEK